MYLGQAIMNPGDMGRDILGNQATVGTGKSGSWTWEELMSDDFYEFLAELHKLQDKYKITKVQCDSVSPYWVSGGVSLYSAWDSRPTTKPELVRVSYGYERHVWKDTKE